MIHKIKHILLIAFFCLMPIYKGWTENNTKNELKIIRITPSDNYIENLNQIVLQFNRDVVPVGRMDRDAAEVPVQIKPEVKCKWYWINSSALACNLDQADSLKMATKYQITVNPGIKAEDGATIDQVFNHQFTTLRPEARSQYLSKWHRPGLAEFTVYFNQAVTSKSVAEHVYFEVGGKRIAAEVIPDERYSDNVFFVEVPGSKYSSIPSTEYKKNIIDKIISSGEEARTSWIVKMKKEVPLNTKFIIQVEPGLISPFGTETNSQIRKLSEYTSFPEFQFLRLECYNNDNKRIEILPNTSHNPNQLCNPLSDVVLVFNTPVFRSEIKNNININPGLVEDKNDKAEEEQDYASSSVSLPFSHKAVQTYEIQAKNDKIGFFKRIWFWIKSKFSSGKALGAGLKDQFGRRLTTPINIKFSTDHRRPSYSLPYDDAVIEKNSDSNIPLYVTNIDSYSFNYNKVTNDGAEFNQVYNEILPKVPDIQYATPFALRKILNNKSGVVFGYITTSPKLPNDQTIFAQITPFQLHVKLGHFNSLAWVTDLSNGNPVVGASVTICNGSFKNYAAKTQILANAITDQNGLVKLPGTEILDPELSANWYNHDQQSQLIAWVRKDDDMAMMPLINNFEINSYRLSQNYSRDIKAKYGHMKFWGTTAQGIYRAGDKIQYKIYVRNQNNKQLTPAPKTGYKLKIKDPEGNIVLTENFTPSEFGGYSGEFQIAQNAPIGWYQFIVQYNLAKAGSRIVESEESEESYESQEESVTMRVLVTDFTPIPFKVTNQLNGSIVRPDQKIEVTTDAKLHSGGPYNNASARVTAILKAGNFSSTNPKAQKFYFNSSLPDISFTDKEVFNEDKKLNDKGELVSNFEIKEDKIYYGKLMVESAVQDDRGKSIAATTNVDYFGVNRMVGLYAKDWFVKAGQIVPIEYVVIDEKNNLVKKNPVNFKVEQEITHIAKVKSAGNSYVSDITHEWKETEKNSATSADDPQTYSFTPKEAGHYRITATINDSKNNPHSTQINLWVTGSDYVLWNQEDDNYLEIIPEKNDYKVGDKAKFLVKNPLPGSQALITIERFGIIDQFVQKFNSSTEIIEIQVKPDYTPGFYISVIVNSPRVNKPIEGEVDLGKPTMKIGYVKVPVKDRYKEILVTAKADREIYKPGETVTLSLQAKPKFAKSSNQKNEAIEFVVAVVDESVLDLVQGGTNYYDPYQGFYQFEDLDLRNFNLLTRLVGRQNFAKKGANQGGDGGVNLSARNFFKFVSYWNPSIKADVNGKAQVNFTLPDNLTGWRILAMATNKTDLMGLGQANIKVNKPTEIRPAMPNQVIEGDDFKASFSVMNRTDKKREIMVKIETRGDIQSSKVIPNQKLTLLPYQRQNVVIPIKAGNINNKTEVKTGEITFKISASDEIDGDALEHKLIVNKKRSLITSANYDTTTQNMAEDSIEFPKNMDSDVGSLKVVISPSIIGNIDGAFKYIKDYPYNCWEQKLTKAVMAMNFKGLKPYLSDDLKWAEAETLIKTTLSEASLYQAPNGGMGYFAAGDQYADPYLSAYTALAFIWLTKAGFTPPQAVITNLDNYLSEMLKNSNLPNYYSEEMTSTVRAVALSALSQKGKVSNDDLERYHPSLNKMSLFGKAAYLRAAVEVGSNENLVQEITNKILASANQTGGKFIFNETLSGDWNRILISPIRENCLILDSFTRMVEKQTAMNLVGDVPFKLVRTITQTRGNRDHWENTQENIFCMNALINYSKVYEKEKPDMNIRTSFAGEEFGTAKFSDVRDKQKTFTREFKKDDPGKKGKVTIEKNGSGRIYYSTRLNYSPTGKDAAKPINAGIDIKREYSVEREGKWLLLKDSDQVKPGEIIRVDLYLSIPAARNFVVVDDPVPGGLEPVNRDLANASIIDANKENANYSGGSLYFQFNDWIGYNFSRWSFYRRELRHDSVVYYSDYLSPGNYHLSYITQAIAEGNFQIMPALASEMYDPDVYGKSGAGMLLIGQ